MNHLRNQLIQHELDSFAALESLEYDRTNAMLEVVADESAYEMTASLGCLLGYEGIRLE